MEITLNEPRTFPAGTTVKAYAASNWPGGDQPSGAPRGASTAEAVVQASGALTFTGLAASTRYWAVAEVSGAYRYLSFMAVLAKSSSSAKEVAELKAQVEALAAEIAPLDTDGTFAANSDSRVASQKAAKTYVDAGDLAARGLYAPQLPLAIFPVATPPGYIGNSFVAGEKVPIMARIIVPKAGVLKDLMCFPKTSAGNVAMGIYDTGDAEAGKRTRLFQSGSVAVGTASKWQVVAAEPNIVVKAGQQLDLYVVFDSATVELGRVAMASGNALVLPGNYDKVAGGASPKLSGTTTAIGSIAELPATIAEASITTTANVPSVACRVE